MKIRISKEFTFETASALYGYDGKCENIHGHSYHMVVTVKGYPVEDPKDPKYGMVIDFSQLKKIVKEEIVEEMDHSFVLNENTPHAEFKEANVWFGKRIILLPYQPTCENMLMDFSQRIIRRLPEDVELHSIKLRETDTSFVEWYAEDQ